MAFTDLLGASLNRGQKLPNTSTRTDHALTIRANGRVIGSIQDWSPSQNRTVTHSYEINSASTGNVYENVPGVATGLTINISRFDLYTARMEEIWGPGLNMQMLTDQSSPFTVNESWSKPDTLIVQDRKIFGVPVPKDSYKVAESVFGSRFASDMEIWVYTGCWFSSLGRTHSANGDRITKVNATLMYANKYRAA